jgi:hypothetical protein
MEKFTRESSSMFLPRTWAMTVAGIPRKRAMPQQKAGSSP